MYGLYVTAHKKHQKCTEICRFRDLIHRRITGKPILTYFSLLLDCFTVNHMNMYMLGYTFQSVKSEDMDTNDHSASIKDLNQLTNERESASEDEKHAVAVHGECDGKVSGQAAPYEKLIHCCPVMGVQTQLKNRILSENELFYCGAHINSQCNFTVIAFIDKIPD